MMFEPEGTRYLRVSSMVGLESFERRVPLTDPSLVRDAYLDGRAMFVSDTSRDSRTDTASEFDAGRYSVLVQPFGSDGAVHGVLELVWEGVHPQPPQQSEAAVAMLAQEIGWSIERADLLNTLRRKSTTDTLTGLGNRRAWREHISNLLDEPLCLAIADLDHFKSYNDTYGHRAGDSLLRVLADNWQQVLRGGDILVRWGGEEFAIALPGTTITEAYEVLERLRRAVPMEQSVSIGVAERIDDEPIAELMERADRALYEAKSSGRDRICAARRLEAAINPA
jgi:diguanylate cyclase (GGDEF)-like protein